MKSDETPTGLAPSADPPDQKRRRILAGRGLVMVVAGVALAAFALYAFAALYGLFTSN